jgi:hypothetical protein
LVSIKNHPLTLVHNRGQVYAIPCFTGKYTGWKCTILFPPKKMEEEKENEVAKPV